jgi:hypothetical protein
MKRLIIDFTHVLGKRQNINFFIFITHLVFLATLAKAVIKD